MRYRKLRVIISGGGTGGHIFPAVAIADRLREINPQTEILFVGAEGRMEMEKIPAAGYPIKGLPVAGLQRRLSPANLALPAKVLASLHLAGKIIAGFKPDIVIGVGGYASAPVLWRASGKGIPTLIQEQNGFAGLTNKLLGRRVGKICVAYEGMERFFPADKIVFTGNPIRSFIRPYTEADRREALAYYGLDGRKKQLLVIGGSLGSGTLNRAMKEWISNACPGGEEVEVLWQCGRYYKADVDAFMAGRGISAVRHTDFIGRMDLAYAAADVVVSRSGALSVSEICAAHKAAIFVPSPNVAEDHQTHNALALVRKEAALMIPDAEAPQKMPAAAMELLHDPARRRVLEANAAALAKPDAAGDIVEEVYKLV